MFGFDKPKGDSADPLREQQYYTDMGHLWLLSGGIGLATIVANIAPPGESLPLLTMSALCLLVGGILTAFPLLDIDREGIRFWTRGTSSRRRLAWEDIDEIKLHRTGGDILERGRTKPTPLWFFSMSKRNRLQMHAGLRAAFQAAQATPDQRSAQAEAETPAPPAAEAGEPVGSTGAGQPLPPTEPALLAVTEEEEAAGGRVPPTEPLFQAVTDAPPAIASDEEPGEGEASAARVPPTEPAIQAVTDATPAPSSGQDAVEGENEGRD